MTADDAARQVAELQIELENMSYLAAYYIGQSEQWKRRASSPFLGVIG